MLTFRIYPFCIQVGKGSLITLVFQGLQWFHEDEAAGPPSTFGLGSHYLETDRFPDGRSVPTKGDSARPVDYYWRQFDESVESLYWQSRKAQELVRRRALEIQI